MEYATYDATQADKKLPVWFVFLTDSDHKGRQLISNKNAWTMGACTEFEGVIL